MNPIRLQLTHHNNPVHGPWWRYRCICGTTGGNRNLAAAHQKASRHAATCAAAYWHGIAATAHHRNAKLARHIADLERANRQLVTLVTHATAHAATWQNSAAWLAHNP